MRDGIDVDSCSNVRIEGCNIETADDSISLKSGRGQEGVRIGRPVENVLINNCDLTDSRFACVGIGSEKFRRVVLEEISFRPKVIVDDVEKSHKPAAMRGIDQRLEIVWTPVHGIRREP